MSAWIFVAVIVAIGAFIIWAMLSAPDALDRANREMDEMPNDPDSH